MSAQGLTRRKIGGRFLRTTPVFDTYWRFAAERQRIFTRRVSLAPPPWTDDPILACHRFTNAYRASDRVSQFLIRNVIYTGSQAADEIIFRILLFKLFNKIETWNLICRELGEPSWESFDPRTFSRVLGREMERGERLYSAAYIMPSPPFGSRRKHENHLRLIQHMMSNGAPHRITASKSLGDLFRVLRSYPSLGDFLAFQLAIDINYSTVTNFSEMDFVVAGPGARSGIFKCFEGTDGVSNELVIEYMAKNADREFARLSLDFHKLGDRRPLQLIDCQNLFCEVDKYSRVAHPSILGPSGRTRIKQKFRPQRRPTPQFYPPKWGLSQSVQADTPNTAPQPPAQTELLL